MYATADNPPTDEARPIPPRYWWLKRILAATVVLIVGLVALRLWWGWEADRRLQAKIAEYRAAGQPVLIEDFQHPPVPDEENAALLFMEAADALVFPTDLAESIVDHCGYPDIVSKYSTESSQLIEANAEVLALMREARSREMVDWDIRVTSPVIDLLFPQTQPQKKLGRFLTVAVHHQHLAGDDSAAVETLRDLVFQANTTEQMTGFMITHMLAIAFRSLPEYALESVAPVLSITSGVQPPHPGAPATREQVHALIEDLLNERPAREGWRRAMFEERLLHLDCINLLVNGTWGPTAFGRPGGVWKALRPAVTPSLQFEALEMLLYSSKALEAGLEDNYQVAKASEPCYPAFSAGIERRSHRLSAILVSDLQRATELHYRVLAMCRMAATALAIRLYEVDHGARPSSLDELVPQYLDSVPIDILANDNRQISYLPNAPKPVLYCVGSDGEDDGGAYTLKDSDFVDMDALDLVFFLNGDRPRAELDLLADQSASEQTVVDQGEIVGDGGESEQDQAADGE